MYNEFIVQNFISFGYNFTYHSQDRGFLEVFGPKGLNLSLNKISTQINNTQTGLPYHYALFIFVGVLFSILLLIKQNLFFEIFFILALVFNKKI